MESLEYEKIKTVKDDFRFKAAIILECLLYVRIVIQSGGCNYD